MHSVSDLRRHEGFSSAYLDAREVVVWLPEGYDGSDDGSDDGSNAGSDQNHRPEPSSRTSAENLRPEPSSRTSVQNLRRYPVLYMHDGQNLFDPDTAFLKGQHWRIGETAADLIEASRIEPLIIVGINNTGQRRVQEYTPTRDARLGGGRADDYGRMIVEELKPYIDGTYRTRPEAANTAIGGSSLGGLVTLYLGLKYPRVFSKLGVLSPSVWWDRRAILKMVRQTRTKPPLRIWVDMGTAEGRRGLEDARLLKAALVGAGWLPGQDLHYAEYEGATHSEEAWALRVGPMLEWLFPPAAG